MSKEEDAFRAAKREVVEETGIQEINVIKYLWEFQRPSGSEKVIKNIRMYLFTTIDTKLNIEGSEVKKAKRFTIDWAKKKLWHPEDKDFLNSKTEEIYDIMNLQYTLESREKDENPPTTDL